MPETRKPVPTARIAVGIAIALLIGALVTALFMAPLGRVGVLVDLITGIAWPLAVLIGLVAFWPHLQAIATEAVVRTQKGAEVRIGGILAVGAISEQAARLPTPTGAEPVTARNIALLHTSFLRPEKTQNGVLYYQFEVIVIAGRSVMDRIEEVTYHLEDAWPSDLRRRPTTDRASRFKLKDLANGTSIVTADIRFNDGSDPITLNRFIDLRPDGPRL